MTDTPTDTPTGTPTDAPTDTPTDTPTVTPTEPKTDAPAEPTTEPAADLRPLRVFTRPSSAPAWWLPTLLEPLREALGIAPGRAFHRAVAGDWATSDQLVLSDPASADIAVLGFGLEATAEQPELLGEAEAFVAEAFDNGLATLVFCQGDLELASPGPGAVMVRTSAHRRRLQAHDVVMPAWIADPALEAPLSARSWQPVPVVSFTGQAYPLGTGAGRATRVKAGVRMGLALAGGGRVAALAPYAIHPARVRTVSALRKSSVVRPRVSLRGQATRLDMERPEDADPRREFLESVLDSDYVLAPRGFGNYSYRLYEALALGRVPVLPDTGAPLPCAELPWDELVVRVPWARPFDQAVLRRHQELQQEWPSVQERCREAWVSHLSATGWFGRLVRVLTGPLESTSAAVVAAALR